MLDILSLFRRKRRVPPRRRKSSSGNWRQELEKIGGLVGNTKAPARVTDVIPRFESLPRHDPQPYEPPAPRFDSPPLDGHAPYEPSYPATEQPYSPASRYEPPAQYDQPPQYDPRVAETRTIAEAPKRFEPPRPASESPRRIPAPRAPVKQGYLAAHGIEKTFGTRKVVKGASLYVRRGEAVGLLGPNGAGKTTIFYMITGLIKADRGRIELDGHDVTGLPMYQRARLGIGYLPQEASIFRGLNVEENIRAVLEVVEPDKKRRERDLDALLDEFNITRLRKSPSIALSGGERRRVEIARALASRPSYMLLDEPFAGIDPIAVGDIQQLVHHLKQRGIGVLITDHNVRETLGLTDRAYIIYSGEVLMEGRAEDIVNNPDVRRLYLGEEFRL
ncbi:MAG: LPS export ABC transporter ATP-binding protein [Pseudorhodoplanes sp.]|nr:LPS export ABC transporter ATP-binding protein [Pseudorhodoplanes sp.]